ncbi:hypothetical protein EON83_20220 [bacterium]|nr:MAG: hypothetical protein EON83_20220 [bacterium]
MKKNTNTATETTATEEEPKQAASVADPLFDIFQDEDEDGNPVSEVDAIALLNTPIVVKVKVGVLTRKIALDMSGVDMATWLADDAYRRDFFLQKGITGDAEDDAETALQIAHAQDEIFLDPKRWQLRAALVIAALARNEEGTPLTSIKELRDAPTVATLTESGAFNKWGRTVIQACCTEIDSFFTA